MKQLLALWRREYLEHRGAFLYAPVIILGIATFGFVAALTTSRFRMPSAAGELRFGALRFYEMGLMGMSALWWVYLLIALFFYYADAFSADRRNNAMFFWKSMPVTDFKILGSKMTAGMTVFPAINLGIVLVSGVILYLLTLLAVMLLPRLVLPGIGDIATSYVSIAWFALVNLVLGLLWYAPFFAWVGALSTVVKRWSIPLAFLIPAVIMALENIASFGNNGPDGGYIFQFLKARLGFGLDREVWQSAFLSGDRVNVSYLLSSLMGSIDWVALIAGLAVAVVLVFAASEYRRRVIDT
jgi:ABC-2 type transport system permease protein